MSFRSATVALRTEGPERFRLLEDVVYEGHDEVFIIPAGTVTDFATVPGWATWLFPKYGTFTKAAILHDYLCYPQWLPGDAPGEVYYGSPVSRRDADGLFRRVLREDEVSYPRRWTMWAAVRVGGEMRDATTGDWVRVALVGAVAVPYLLIPVSAVAIFAAGFRLIEDLSDTVEALCERPPAVRWV